MSSGDTLTARKETCLESADSSGGSAEPAGAGSASTVPEQQRWSLADLYPDQAAFTAAKQSLQERLPALDAFRGRLARSGRDLAQALDALSETRKELGRLYAYASMLSDEDTRVAAHQAMRQEIELLFTDYSRRAAFARPEILAMEPGRIDEFLEAEPALGPFRHFLEDLIRQREHVLGAPEERIMAEAGLLAGGPSAVFNLLDNAELPRPEVTLSTNETVTLTPSDFSRHRTTSNRGDRRLMFETYFSAYRPFRATLGQNLYQAIKSHMFGARSRRYDSSLTTALDAENIPVPVYRNLIDQVRAQLPVLHRYFRLRARALGLETMEYYDLYCPLVADHDARYTVERSHELVRASLAPLGPEYSDGLDRAWSDRWIDWHPQPGKRAGAYATGSAYDVHPYVLLNFHGDYESLSTLTHELGHALHSYFSNRAQPYPTAEYPIFVAEVASTSNEALLNAHVLEEATGDRERLFLLGSYLDGLRATMFRQTMFAEFELAIHERAERGEALTGELLDEMYLDLLRHYHGHDDGVVQVADGYAVEWATIPHFFYNFYVYQYATGIVAATALAEALLSDQPGARQRYLEFLSSGGSDYSLELLRRAGVDLEQPEPYQATIRAMNHKLDQLEALLD